MSASFLSPVTRVRDNVVRSTSSLFSHGPSPLENTLDYLDDPGLLGPNSMSWEVIGDAAAFVGGIRALIVQTAHPEVVAGVEQHSRYRTDPLGRLTRTSAYVTEATYGARPEVEAAVATVQRAHRGVAGTSERQRPYRAFAPAMAAWVHNVLTDSFLAAFNAYGRRPLSMEEQDRFVEEQTRIGARLGADPMPTTATSLHHWIDSPPDLDRTGDQRSAIQFLQSPPLPLAVRVGYRILFEAAVASLPPSMGDHRTLPPARFTRCWPRNGEESALGAWLLTVVAPLTHSVQCASASRPVPPTAARSGQITPTSTSAGDIASSLSDEASTE